MRTRVVDSLGGGGQGGGALQIGAGDSQRAGGGPRLRHVDTVQRPDVGDALPLLAHRQGLALWNTLACVPVARLGDPFCCLLGVRGWAGSLHNKICPEHQHEAMQAVLSATYDLHPELNVGSCDWLANMLDQILLFGGSGIAGGTCA